MTVFGGQGQPTASLVGVPVVRFDAAWGSFEPRPGIYDFTTLDTAVNLVRAKGSSWLAILDYGPAWGEDPYAPPVSRFDIDRFGKAAGEVARRYRDILWGLEVWNEPNMRRFGDVTAQQYARLYRAAENNVRGIPLICGSVTDRTGWREYLADIIRMCDPQHASVHAYTRLSTVREARRIVGHNRQLWLTETGMRANQPARTRRRWMNAQHATCIAYDVHTAIAYSLDDPAWMLTPSLRANWLTT